MTDTPPPFAIYLAKRIAAERGFDTGIPLEAKGVGEHADICLSLASFGLAMVCIVDWQAEPSKKFAFTQEALVAIGRECLKYTGSINGTKMPVGFTLYEVGDGPPTDDDRARLAAMHKAMPGLSKVVVHCFYIDARNRTVWSPAIFNGLLRGRRWIEGVLREPRKVDAEIFAEEAVVPDDDRKPVATGILLTVLAALFVVEHLAKIGNGKAPGFFGVDVQTLYALGGMNSEAVLENGEWYRTLSAALFHADAFHLVFNGIALGLAGYVLESLLGRAWFVTLFFVGALGGSLLGLVINPSNIVSVGASGAIMGLLAAALVATYRYPPGATRTQLQMPLLQFLIPSLIPLATSRHGGHVDFAAHVGGAIAGSIAGVALMKIWPKNEAQPRFSKVANALAVLSIFAFVGSLGLVRCEYGTLASEAGFTSQDLLVDQKTIPDDPEVAKREVDVWGKGHPRDPRVHLGQAMRFEDQGKFDDAERELRAALAEKEILERAFSGTAMESSLRRRLILALVKQGKRDEAKSEAEPLCTSSDQETKFALTSLGLCPP